MMIISKIKKIIPRTIAAIVPVPMPVFSVAAPTLAEICKLARSVKLVSK
jgi:hypothetical protein